MRIALLGVLAAGVMVTQQACANGTAAEPVAAPQSAETTAATESPEPTEPTETPDPDEGAVPVCKNGDVAADITLQPDQDGDTRTGLVTLTNESGTECGVHGHALISLVDAAGEVAEVPTEKVQEPGASIRTALKSGSSAFQGIKWTICDKSDAACGTGNTLVFTLEAGTDGEPAKLSGFPASEKNGITMKSLQIGTIQPDRQGVVAW